MDANTSDDAFVVTYTLRDGDYLAFHKRVRKLTLPTAATTAIRWLLVPCALAFGVYRSPFVAGDLARAAGLWGVIALLWIGYTAWASRAAILRVNFARPGAKAPRTTRLNAEGVTVETAATTVLQSWPAIVRIDADAHRIYFYLSPESAVIVPIAAFASPEDAERFLKVAREYHATQSISTQDAALLGGAAIEAEPPGSIRVRYTLAPDDLLHYYRLVGRAELMRAVIGTVVVCALLIACVDLLYGLSPFFGLPIMGFYLVLVAVMMGFQVDRNRRRKAQRLPASEQTLVLTPTGVEERLPLSRSRTPWKSVLTLRETSTLFLLTLAPQNAFVIPKRAFGSAEEAQVFFRNVRSLRESALSGSAPMEVEQVQSWPPPPRR